MAFTKTERIVAFEQAACELFDVDINRVFSMVVTIRAGALPMATITMSAKMESDGAVKIETRQVQLEQKSEDEPTAKARQV